VIQRTLRLVLALSAIAVMVTIAGGVRHDYVDYLAQWALVLAHDNPWSTNNAYGPLHNAFALLVPIRDLAPKIVTAVALLIANAMLVLNLVVARPTREWLSVYLTAFGANVLVLVSAFWFGLNDALVAALVLGAVLARHERAFLLAGVLLGLAALDKYYPALLIPFFALDARMVQPRVLIGSLATIVLGMLAATLLWGSAWIEAVTYGVSRDATILSVLRPIVVAGRALGAGPIVDLLVRFNGPLVVAVWLLSVWGAWVRRDTWLVAACWGIFAVLLTYKVGNPQFWVTWLALVAALPLLRTPEADRLARLARPYAIFLSAFELGYVLLQPQYYLGPWLWVNDVAGIPSAVLGAILLVAFLWRRPAPSPETLPPP
jgi:hypothetical protein